MRLYKPLIVLLITAFAFSVGNATPPTTKTTNIKVESLQKIYTSQIGVREATGNNDGKFVEMYLQTVGLTKGYPWCAAFVKWCYLEVGILEATKINGMALSVDKPDERIYYKGKFTNEPRAGDAFTLFYPKLNRIGHTGFFDKRQNESIFLSVEGNTNGQGSREGDGVYRKYRSFKATYSICRWVAFEDVLGKVMSLNSNWRLCIAA